MSWQDYVDNQLIASHCVSKAAIAGHDGSVWAKTAGFEVGLDTFICNFPMSTMWMRDDEKWKARNDLFGVFKIYRIKFYREYIREATYLQH